MLPSLVTQLGIAHDSHKYLTLTNIILLNLFDSNGWHNFKNNLFQLFSKRSAENLVSR